LGKKELSLSFLFYETRGKGIRDPLRGSKVRGLFCWDKTVRLILYGSRSKKLKGRRGGVKQLKKPWGQKGARSIEIPFHKRGAAL